MSFKFSSKHVKYILAVPCYIPFTAVDFIPRNRWTVLAHCAVPTSTTTKRNVVAWCLEGARLNFDLWLYVSFIS
jgi:hypothetical protein